MNKPSYYLVLLIVLLTGLAAGRYLVPAGVGSDNGISEKEPLYWVAPMDPNFRSDKPGKSPMGMDLIPVYEENADATVDASTVRINPVVVNNLGVRTAPVEYGRLHRTVNTVGYVEYSEDTLDHLHPRVEGWIEKLYVDDTGDPITRGEPLFEIYSRELVTAQEELLAVQRSGNSQLLAASVERLRSLGMSEEQIRELRASGSVKRTVEVTATVTGVVAALNVREGMFVRPSTEVMSLASLDDIWVIAEVFERHGAAIETNQTVSLEFEYMPGKTWPAEVDYVYPELDPQTRSLQVRIRLKNPGIALKPGMFARVSILGEQTEESVHIPREALIRGSVDRVVLAVGDGRFKAVPVTVGIESGDRVQILDGLAKNHIIVTSGQFLIDSESDINAEILRASDNDTDDVNHDSMEHDSMTMDNGQGGAN